MGTVAMDLNDQAAQCVIRIGRGANGNGREL
jgi:hypothetical protein